jgi:hypothetical protein
MPPEIAIATAKSARRMAAAVAVQRRRKPASSAMPRIVSAIVAAIARNGASDFGRNEFTSAVYAMNCANGCAPRSCHSPKRAATAERNALPRAIRA